VVIGPDRPPACRHGHLATVHPAQALPLVNRGHGQVQRSGDICQPVFVRLADRWVHHAMRAGAMPAAVTQHPCEHPPTEPLRAFGGRKTVAIEVRGDLRTAQTTAASGVDPVAEDLVRRELVRPRDRSHHTLLTADPTRPVDRDRDVFARAWAINGDTRKPQAHPLLPVLRGGLRRLPQGRHVLG
jgi:hypothetical protein